MRNIGITDNVGFIALMQKPRPKKAFSYNLLMNLRQYDEAHNWARHWLVAVAVGEYTMYLFRQCR